MLLVALALTVIAHNPAMMRGAWYVLLVGAGVIGAAALWFTGLQLFQLQQYCIYCLTIHGCGLCAALLIVISAPLAAPIPERQGPLRMHSQRSVEQSETQPMATPATTEINMVSGFAAATAGTLLPMMLAAGQMLFPSEAGPTYVIEIAAAPSDSSSSADPKAAIMASAAEQARRDAFSSISDRLADAAPSRSSAEPEDSALEELFPESSESSNSPAKTPSNRTDESASDILETAEEENEAKKSENQRWLSLLRGKFFFDAGEHLRIGELQAEHMLVKLFDYTCPHCRLLHEQLEVADDELGEQMAIVLLPIPFEKSCNPRIQSSSPIHKNACLYARLAIVVWRTEPEKFRAFHEYLMHGDEPPAPADARARAELLIGDGKLDAALSDSAVGKYIEQCVDTYARLGEGRIPKLIIGDATMTGEARDGEELTKIIRDHFGITEPKTP